MFEIFFILFFETKKNKFDSRTNIAFQCQPLIVCTGS